MIHRVVSLAAVAIALAVFVAAADAAEKEKKNVHRGEVVSAGSGKLVMTTDGKEHSHDVGADVKIMIEGRPAKLEDLKPGTKIRVKTDDSGKVLAVMAGRGKKKAD